MRKVCTWFIVVWLRSVLPISFRVTSLAPGNHKIVPAPVKQPWRIWVNILHQSTGIVYLTITQQSSMHILWDTLQLWMGTVWSICIFTHSFSAVADKLVWEYRPDSVQRFHTYVEERKMFLQLLCVHSSPCLWRKIFTPLKWSLSWWRFLEIHHNFLIRSFSRYL